MSKKKMSSARDPHPNGMVAHLMCTKEDIGEYVLMPGDPGRVHMFKDLLDDFQIVAINREYTIGTGWYHGVKISVCSTGIGAPSTEIACVELMELGAKAMIRIGGCGVLRKDVPVGAMVINTGAVRKGGSSCFYAPNEYPAVASYEVVDSLVKACKSHDAVYATGISASIGSFFAGQARPVLGRTFYEEDLIEEYKKRNVLNMEMEAETILTLGSIFGVYAGAICAVHANRETDEWLDDFEPAQKEMCRIALDACLYLKENY